MTESYDKLNHWYGWNGGECPVHPDTEVQVMLADGGMLSRVASLLKWNYLDMPSTIVVFQIVKPYVPKVKREVALYRDCDGCLSVIEWDESYRDGTISEPLTIEFTLLEGETP